MLFPVRSWFLACSRARRAASSSSVRKGREATAGGEAFGVEGAEGLACLLPGWAFAGTEGFDVLGGLNRYDLTEGMLDLRNKPLLGMGGRCLVLGEAGPSVAKEPLAAGWLEFEYPAVRIWERWQKR